MAILRLPPRNKRHPSPARPRPARDKGDSGDGVARCPKCDRPMALRYGRREVVFVCGCGERPALRHRAA